MNVDPNDILCSCGHPGAWHLTDSRLCAASVGPDAVNSGAGAFLTSSGGTQCPCAGFTTTGAHWLDNAYGVLKDVPAPADAPLHRLRDGTTGTTLEALTEAQREVEALKAPPVTRADYLACIAALTVAYERSNEGVILGVNVEFDETSAFGWDGETMGPCDPLHVTVATATDAQVEARDARIADLEREKAALDASFQRECREHAETANKLDDWRDKYATVADGFREALAASEAALAKEPVMCRHCGGTGRADSIDGAAECPQCGGNGTDDEREQFEEGINFLHGYWGLREETAAAIAQFRAIAESFHPTAQPPVTTGESAPGIVSPVATKDSVATVARGADDAWAAKLLRFILDDVTFDERHGDDGRRAVEHAIRALAP